MHTQLIYHQALIYLLATIIAVPITKRLGFGSVLGFLLAGIAIGPWGLRLITDVQSILHISEFGVVLLLFLIGLELNPQKVWDLRRSLLGMGSAQILLTILIFTSISLVLGLSLNVALVIGMCLSMSSTAITLQLLGEKNLLPTPAGQAAFAITLFQDLTVVPFILLLKMLAPSQVGRDNVIWQWVPFFKGLAIILIVIFAGRYLLRPLLRYIASTGLREIFIASSLLLVLGVAVLMQEVGLSMALGAFLAGVLLANSEYRYQLELDIEPFKGLLLGLFFISIGMSLNLGLFFQNPFLVIGLALAVVFVKIILLYAISLGFKYNRNDAKTIALYLSQVGEFAFVLISLSLQQRVFAKYQADLLNSIVAISMLTTPFLLLLNDNVLARWQRQAPPKKADKIDEHNPVILGGSGRIGGVILRLLAAKGIGATVIDHDPNQILLLQRFGLRAYYGDIARLDLLLAAGAAKAKILIIAIDDSQAALKAARVARQYFPHLKILARARSRIDAFEFAEEEVHLFRETFGSAMNMAQATLETLGYSRITAKKIVQQFEKHDCNMLKRGAKHRGDQQALISLAQQGLAELEKLLRSEDLAIKKQEDSK